MIHSYGFLPQTLAATVQFNVDWTRFIVSMIVIFGGAGSAMYLNLRTDPKNKKK